MHGITRMPLVGVDETCLQMIISLAYACIVEDKQLHLYVVCLRPEALLCISSTLSKFYLIHCERALTSFSHIAAHGRSRDWQSDYQCHAQGKFLSVSRSVLLSSTKYLTSC